MLFVSYEFIGFLILLLLGYYTVFKKFQWQLLLAVSCGFYALAGKEYILYISGMTGAVYFTALKLSELNAWEREKKKSLKGREYEHIRTNIRKKRRIWLFSGLLSSLGVLLVVKYTDFVIANINFVKTELFGGQPQAFANFLLPLGISFYTFKSIGYLLDVFRGKYDAEKNLGRFALFVSFFPQLIQGPISRFDKQVLSLYKQHEFNGRLFIRGLYRVLWGYFKKVVVADRVVTAVITVTASPERYSGAFVLLGMMLYAVQIYADFTGGIDITLGIAEMLGIEVEENFIRPYFSKSVKEYWNRWHITMGSWFKEYVFYPLSISDFMLFISRKSKKIFGNGAGRKIPVYLSTLTVWFLTGLWHGASWNFIVWGLLNGVIILVSEELKGVYRLFHSYVPVTKLPFRIYDAFRILRTIFIMSSLRLLDCYEDVNAAFGAFISIFAINDIELSAVYGLGLKAYDFAVIAVSVVIMFAVSLNSRDKDLRDKILKRSEAVQHFGLAVLFFIIIIFGAYGMGYDARQFIYNRF